MHVSVTSGKLMCQGGQFSSARSKVARRENWRARKSPIAIVGEGLVCWPSD